LERSRMAWQLFPWHFQGSVPLYLAATYRDLARSTAMRWASVRH